MSASQLEQRSDLAAVNDLRAVDTDESADETVATQHYRVAMVGEGRTASK